MRPDRESDPVDDVFLGRICGAASLSWQVNLPPTP